MTKTRTEISDRKTYYLLSGEGTGSGSVEIVYTTERGIKHRLTRERAGGDRWARAMIDPYETTTGGFAATDIETGEVRSLPLQLRTKR